MAGMASTPQMPSERELVRAAQVVDRIRQVAAHTPEVLLGLDWEAFVQAATMLPPQSYGPLIEQYLVDRFGWNTVPKTEDRGDAYSPKDGYIEIKATLVRQQGGRVNFVHLRPHQDLDHYCLVVIDLSDGWAEPNVFWVEADKMKEEIRNAGLVAAGTKRAQKGNRNLGYALRFRWAPDDDTWQRWMSAYRHPDMSEQLAAGLRAAA